MRYRETNKPWTIDPGRPLRESPLRYVYNVDWVTIFDLSNERWDGYDVPLKVDLQLQRTQERKPQHDAYNITSILR